MTPDKIAQLANRGNAAARFLMDNGFHAEVLYRYVFDRPAGISPRDPTTTYLGGRIDHQFYEAIAHPGTLAHRRRAFEGSSIVRRGRLSRTALREAGQHEGQARQAQNRPSRPIDFFFGMDLVTTAAVGVIEIFLDVRKIRVREDKEGNVPPHRKYLPQPKSAQWTLVQALLAGTSGRLVTEVARLANRGRHAEDPELDKQSGDSRFRTAKWSLRYYLPPSPEPGSASRFDRACWLEPDRDVAFWDEFQRDVRSLGGQRLKRLQLWLTHRIWLVKFQRYFAPLRTRMKPDRHTAKIWTRWFSTVMPLNTDTVLTFLLLAARERGKRSNPSQ